MSASTPVVVTHPCDILRDGLRQTLAKSRFRPLSLAATVNDIERHLQSCSEPGCIWVLGVKTFDADHEHLVRKIKSGNSTIRVVVLAASWNAADIIRALTAGVSSFLSQDIPTERLLKSLEATALGDTVISPTLWTAASESRSSAGSDGTNPANKSAVECPLSNRELSILRTLIDGASNKEIAQKLVLTETTVNVHLKAILRKLRLHNRTQAALWARNYLGGVHSSTTTSA